MPSWTAASIASRASKGWSSKVRAKTRGLRPKPLAAVKRPALEDLMHFSARHSLPRLPGQDARCQGVLSGLVRRNNPCLDLMDKGSGGVSHPTQTAEL